LSRLAEVLASFHGINRKVFSRKGAKKTLKKLGAFAPLREKLFR